MTDLFYSPETEECIHLNITDFGICTFCGVDITSSEFIDSLPELTYNENAIDIIHLIQLAEETVKTYLNGVSENRDPKDPSQLKLRVVGSQITRLPDSVLWNAVIQPSYGHAKLLGYKGDYPRWNDICREYLRQ